jgi:2-hydroxychromene-2-carboxylate isomerase
MIKPFEFYFDFASPYSYLAHKKIRRLEKENSIKIKYKPILLGGLLNLAGIKANADIPVKGKYMIKDCKLWAEKDKIEFKFNTYFPIYSLNLMRCVLISEKDGNSYSFINKIYDAIWKEDINLNDIKNIEKLINALHINSVDFLMKANSPEVKSELKKNTDHAFEKGIFGAPSFLVNNKIFWGQDRLEFAVNEAKK